MDNLTIFVAQKGLLLVGAAPLAHDLVATAELRREHSEIVDDFVRIILLFQIDEESDQV